MKTKIYTVIGITLILIVFGIYEFFTDKNTNHLRKNIPENPKGVILHNKFPDRFTKGIRNRERYPKEPSFDLKELENEISRTFETLEKETAPMFENGYFLSEDEEIVAELPDIHNP